MKFGDHLLVDTSPEKVDGTEKERGEDESKQKKKSKKKREKSKKKEKKNISRDQSPSIEREKSPKKKKDKKEKSPKKEERGRKREKERMRKESESPNAKHDKEKHKTKKERQSRRHRHQEGKKIQLGYTLLDQEQHSYSLDQLVYEQQQHTSDKMVYQQQQHSSDQTVYQQQHDLPVYDGPFSEQPQPSQAEQCQHMQQILDESFYNDHPSLPAYDEPFSEQHQDYQQHQLYTSMHPRLCHELGDFPLTYEEYPEKYLGEPSSPPSPRHPSKTRRASQHSEGAQAKSPRLPMYSPEISSPPSPQLPSEPPPQPSPCLEGDQHKEGSKYQDKSCQTEGFMPLMPSLELPFRSSTHPSKQLEGDYQSEGLQDDKAPTLYYRTEGPIPISLPFPRQPQPPNQASDHLEGAQAFPELHNHIQEDGDEFAHGFPSPPLLTEPYGSRYLEFEEGMSRAIWMNSPPLPCNEHVR